MTESALYATVLIVVIVMAGVGVTVQPAQTVPILGFAGLIATSLIALLQSSKAAVKVSEVAVQARVQAAHIDTLTAIAHETKALVNGSYGASLMATLLALRSVARLTTNPADKRAADAAVVEAERLYAEHQASQTAVDAGAPSQEDCP